jgi:hypothetical protein
VAYLRALAVVVLSGCGLVLDLDPPDPEGIDANVSGMDAGMNGRMDAGRDAGRPVECDTDIDCDDGAFCNGAERCEAAVCVGGVAPGCDDRVDCTVDACDEATDACAHRADDTVCESHNECLRGVCTPGVGCTTAPSNEACDDMVECTIDVCDANGACLHGADASLCARGEICTEAGCQAPPMCGEGRPCPVIACQHVECIGGVCTYEADTNRDGVACQHPDPCVDARCMAGACVAPPPVLCAPLNTCQTASCARSAEGLVSCVRQAAENDTVCASATPCTGPGVCTSGVCAGGVSTCVDVSACTNAVCASDGTTCRIDNACGRNQICDPGRGCICSAGFEDCNGDGNCECPRIDAATACSGSTCRMPDGGVSANDAGPGRDAGHDAGAFRACLAGVNRDCDGIAGCECDLNAQFCSNRRCLPCPTACPEGTVCCACGGVGAARCVTSLAVCGCDASMP